MPELVDAGQHPIATLPQVRDQVPPGVVPAFLYRSLSLREFYFGGTAASYGTDSGSV